MSNIPNTPQVVPGTASAPSAAGAIIPQYRTGNYYPRLTRLQGPGGIQSGGVANPAYPAQTGRPGGSQGVNPNGPMQPIQQAGSTSAPSGPWWSFTASPVPWLLVFLVLSILLLRYVHYGY